MSAIRRTFVLALALSLHVSVEGYRVKKKIGKHSAAGQTQSSTPDSWRIPAQETDWGYNGPYTKITECRESLATHFPQSLWRSDSTAGSFQMGYVLDIPVDFGRCREPHKVNVYFPLDSKGLPVSHVPVISYGHGLSNGGSALHGAESERLFRPLVEQGFFVIAYQHGGTSIFGYCAFKDDQLGALNWLATSEYASQIDFDRMGVMGHSMGGKASLNSAAAGVSNIKAAVTLNAHCINDCPVPTVPTLMITGNHDTLSKPELQRPVFDRMTVPGYFAGLVMGHSFNDVWALVGMHPLIITMFRCYLLDDSRACSELDQLGPSHQTCFGEIWSIN